MRSIGSGHRGIDGLRGATRLGMTLAVRDLSGSRPLADGRIQTMHEEETMFVTTTFTIEGYQILEYKGVVRGIIVRAPTIAQGILGGLKNIIGGRIGAYTDMCEQARQQAYDLLLK